MAEKKSMFFAVRTTAGQEVNVALLMEARAKAQKLDVRSIIVPPGVKGYVIVEAPGLHVLYNLVRDLKHVKGHAHGRLSEDDVAKMVSPKAVLEWVKEGDIVEIVAGPFRGMKAKVVRVDVAKNEAVLNILEAAFQLQITVPGDYIRPARRAS